MYITSIQRNFYNVHLRIGQWRHHTVRIKFLQIADGLLNKCIFRRTNCETVLLQIKLNTIITISNNAKKDRVGNHRENS